MRVKADHASNSSARMVVLTPVGIAAGTISTRSGSSSSPSVSPMAVLATSGIHLTSADRRSMKPRYAADAHAPRRVVCSSCRCGTVHWRNDWQAGAHDPQRGEHGGIVGQSTGLPRRLIGALRWVPRRTRWRWMPGWAAIRCVTSRLPVGQRRRRRGRVSPRSRRGRPSPRCRRVRRQPRSRHIRRPLSGSRHSQPTGCICRWRYAKTGREPSYEPKQSSSA